MTLPDANDLSNFIQDVEYSYTVKYESGTDTSVVPVATQTITLTVTGDSDATVEYESVIYDENDGAPIVISSH